MPANLGLIESNRDNAIQRPPVMLVAISGIFHIISLRWRK